MIYWLGELGLFCLFFGRREDYLDYNDNSILIGIYDLVELVLL